MSEVVIKYPPSHFQWQRPLLTTIPHNKDTDTPGVAHPHLHHVPTSRRDEIAVRAFGLCLIPWCCFK